jgi:hypothetical protein
MAFQIQSLLLMRRIGRLFQRSLKAFDRGAPPRRVFPSRRLRFRNKHGLPLAQSPLMILMISGQLRFLCGTGLGCKNPSLHLHSPFESAPAISHDLLLLKYR